MKKSVLALLIMVGLVGGVCIIGCGGGEESVTEKTIEQTGEKMEEAAETAGDTAETMKEEAEGSAPQ